MFSGLQKVLFPSLRLPRQIASVGCLEEGLLHRDLPQHLAAATQAISTHSQFSMMVRTGTGEFKRWADPAEVPLRSHKSLGLAVLKEMELALCGFVAKTAARQLVDSLYNDTKTIVKQGSLQLSVDRSNIDAHFVEQALMCLADLQTEIRFRFSHSGELNLPKRELAGFSKRYKDALIKCSRTGRLPVATASMDDLKATDALLLSHAIRSVINRMSAEYRSDVTGNSNQSQALANKFYYLGQLVLALEGKPMSFGAHEIENHAKFRLQEIFNESWPEIERLQQSPTKIQSLFAENLKRLFGEFGQKCFLDSLTEDRWLSKMCELIVEGISTQQVKGLGSFGKLLENEGISNGHHELKVQLLLVDFATR